MAKNKNEQGKPGAKTRTNASPAKRRIVKRDMHIGSTEGLPSPDQAPPRMAHDQPKTSPIERRRATREGARKQWGEIAESHFFAKAVTQGFGVAKPWGDSDPYDFILDAGGARLHRIQVKSSSRACGKGKYRATLTASNRRRYTKDDVDFVVAYIVPKDAWYILPIHAVGNVGGISFYPDGLPGRSKYEKYREAWCQLACKHDDRKRRSLLRVCWHCRQANHCVVR